MKSTKEALISVVIPVYNVEKYLKRCLDSVLSQTYRQTEIIVVDDGSKDGSGKICDKYKKKDARIKVFHKSNGGLSDARNFGMTKATGKYITFVDSDDCLDENFLSCLYGAIKRYDADIATCGEIQFEALELPKTKLEQGGIKVMSSDEALEKMLYQTELYNSAWGKLYKRALLDGIEYPVGKIYEDVGTTYKILLRAKKVAVCKSKLYFYFQRKDAISKRAFSESTLDMIEMVEQMDQEATMKRPQFKKAVQSRKLNAYYFVLRQMPKKHARRRELIKKIKTLRKSVLADKHVRNKTKVGIVLSYIGFWTIPIVYKLSNRLEIVKKLA